MSPRCGNDSYRQDFETNYCLVLTHSLHKNWPAPQVKLLSYS